MGGGSAVILGDFNAHHVDWGKRTDRRGRVIKWTLEGVGWDTIVGTADPSFRREVEGQIRQSTIDLA